MSDYWPDRDDEDYDENDGYDPLPAVPFGDLSNPSEVKNIHWQIKNYGPFPSAKGKIGKQRRQIFTAICLYMHFFGRVHIYNDLPKYCEQHFGIETPDFYEIWRERQYRFEFKDETEDFFTQYYGGKQLRWIPGSRLLNFDNDAVLQDLAIGPERCRDYFVKGSARTHWFLIVTDELRHLAQAYRDNLKHGTDRTRTRSRMTMAHHAHGEFGKP